MKSRESDSPKWRADAQLVTGDTTMTKSEIALLTVTVLGTLAGWLAVQHPSLLSPTHGAPRIACSVSTSAFSGVRPSFSEENPWFNQVLLTFHAFS
jgi:hypothetical protein